MMFYLRVTCINVSIDKDSRDTVHLAKFYRDDRTGE